MTTYRPHASPDVRAAAVTDANTSGDSIAVVAARHGIPRSTLGRWVKQAGHDELGYAGADRFDPTTWELRGGVLRPLYPARRSA